MKNNININLIGLTERQKNNIAKVLKQSLYNIPDKTNQEALELLCSHNIEYQGKDDEGFEICTNCGIRF